MLFAAFNIQIILNTPTTPDGVAADYAPVDWWNCAHVWVCINKEVSGISSRLKLDKSLKADFPCSSPIINNNRVCKQSSAEPQPFAIRMFGSLIWSLFQISTGSGGQYSCFPPRSIKLVPGHGESEEQLQGQGNIVHGSQEWVWSCHEKANKGEVTVTQYHIKTIPVIFLYQVMIDNIMGNGLDIPLSGLREASKWDRRLARVWPWILWLFFQRNQLRREPGIVWKWLLQQAQYLHALHQSGGFKQIFCAPDFLFFSLLIYDGWLPL